MDLIADGYTALTAAARHGHIEAIKYFKNVPIFAPKQDITSSDAKGRTALTTAAAYGQIQAIQTLLGNNGILSFFKINNGFNITAPDAKGWTPLTAAAQFGEIAVIEYLEKERGVDLTAPDANGFTGNYDTYKQNLNS